MDHSGYSFMDQDQDAVLMGDAGAMDYDHVRWQGSQTANQALNQLIRSSVNEPVLAKAKENVNVNGNVGTSRSWQREPSFDQIPGFSLLSTTDSGGRDGSSSWSSSVHRTPQTTSSGKSLASSSRLAHPRSRPSPALAGSTSNAQPSSSSITIPFFDKTNPSQFLDILKGVSARVDANAGVRPRNSTGGIDALPSSRIVKGRKRPRGVSLGSTSDTLVERIKRGRVEALRESGGVNAKAKDKDKGKGRAIPGTDEGAGSSLTGASASRNGGGECAGNLLREKGHISGMDVDCGEGEGDKSMLDLPDQAKNYHSSSSNSSQTKMPPPPPPGPRIKHPTGATSRVFPVVSSSASSSTSTSTSASTSISRLTTTANASHNCNESSVNNTKPQSTSQTPKYHPLLLEPPTKPQPKPQPKVQNPPPHVQSVVAHPILYPKVRSENHHGKPVPAQKPQQSVIVAVPSPSPAPLPLPTSTPHFSSSQSSRPPPLGMRRTHTFPSSSSSSMVTSLQKNGVLPTKQKGFKPPLLSSSQPQPRSQVSQPASQALVAVPAVKEQPSILRGHSKQHLAQTRAPAPASSNGYPSSASDSPRSAGVGGPPSSSLSRSTSNSPASSSLGASKMGGSRGVSLQVGNKPTTTKSCNPAGAVQSAHDPSRAACAPPSTAIRQVQPQLKPRQGLNSRVPVSVPVGAPTPALPTKPPPPPARDASPPLPEPADGDPDSSFGDMSFDMDALEETMRQYD